MPKWIHDRAKHLRQKNPDMPESQSWAIATQQAYAAGKAPGEYGTPQGKKAALKKYDEGKQNYKKTADPKSKTKTSGISLAMVLGFSDELQKIAAQAAGLPEVKGAIRPKTGLPSYSKVQKETPSATPNLNSPNTLPPPPVMTGG